jgi:hypothetical protein
MIKKLLNKHGGIILINCPANTTEEYLLENGISWWNEKSSEKSLSDEYDDVAFIIDCDYTMCWDENDILNDEFTMFGIEHYKVIDWKVISRKRKIECLESC